MARKGFARITKSGVFEWPWNETRGLLVITGAAGGGGGGGQATTVEQGEETYKQPVAMAATAAMAAGFTKASLSRVSRARGATMAMEAMVDTGRSCRKLTDALRQMAPRAARASREKPRLLSLPT